MENQTLEETALRELSEETSINNVYLEQLKTYGDPDRDPRMRIITTAYFALMPYKDLLSRKIRAQDDAEDIEWFSLRRLPKNLAFDHVKILKDLLERLIGKISYTPIAFNLLPQKFTWNELQEIYEIVLNKKFLTPNFRRKIKSMYKLKTLNKKQKIKKGRPSFLLKYEGIRNF